MIIEGNRQTVEAIKANRECDCPRCLGGNGQYGNMVKDSDGWVCLQCGYRPYQYDSPVKAPSFRRLSRGDYRR